MNGATDLGELRPLVALVVEEVLAALGQCTNGGNDRMAFTEIEAASLLGVRPHVLRDARLRGEIVSTKVGGRVSYERAQLEDYLAKNRQR